MIDTTIAGGSPVEEAERIAVHAAALQLQADPWTRRRLGDVSGVLVARHLDAARELLARDGWVQNVHSTPEGRVCALIALERTGPAGSVSAAARYLGLMVHALTGRDQWVLGWNDEPGRTQAEVLDLFDSAADFARIHGPY